VPAGFRPASRLPAWLLPGSCLIPTLLPAPTPTHEQATGARR